MPRDRPCAGVECTHDIRRPYYARPRPYAELDQALHTLGGGGGGGGDNYVLLIQLSCSGATRHLLESSLFALDHHNDVIPEFRNGCNPSKLHTLGFMYAWCKHTHTHTHTRTHARTHTHTRTHARARTHVHAHTHIHTHTHTHTFGPLESPSPKAMIAIRRGSSSCVGINHSDGESRGRSNRRTLLVGAGLVASDGYVRASPSGPEQGGTIAPPGYWSHAGLKLPHLSNDAWVQGGGAC